jgi:hypothetical protein
MILAKRSVFEFFLKRFWWGNLRERDYLKDLGVDGGIILKWIFNKWDGIYLAQGRDR